MRQVMATITIDGREYPCRETMLAWLMFKERTGREVTELDMKSPTELCIYLWACVSAACRADKVDFGLTLDDFAAVMTPQALYQWAAATLLPATESDEPQDGGGDDKKK